MTTRKPRLSARRIFVRILVTAVVLYGGAILYLMTQETRLVFQAGRPLSQSRPPFDYQQVDIPRADGTRQFAWIMRNPDARSWVLYLHGNSATIASRVNIARYRELRALGLNIMAAEYRGFGGLEGSPSEASVNADAQSAFEYLTGTLKVPPTRVVIYGWSLGSAVAVDLGAHVQEAAVVLEGAAASLVAIGAKDYPIFPIRLVMRNPFESIRKVDQINSPMLFLHSPEDSIIPIAEGRRLFDAARQPKQFVEVRGGHINANDVDRDKFFGAIRSFLEEYELLGHQE